MKPISTCAGFLLWCAVDDRRAAGNCLVIPASVVEGGPAGFNLQLVLFFVYGWVYDFVMKHEPVRLPYMTWHWVLVICGYTIVITVGVLLYYQRRDLRPLSRFLSSMFAILLGMCAVKIVHHDVRVYLVGTKHKRQAEDSKLTGISARCCSMSIRRKLRMCTTSFWTAMRGQIR